MKKIQRHAQKKKKPSKKNTGSGVKNEKEDLTLYKLTKQNEVDIIRDPHLNPKANKSRIENKFIDEYIGFFRFFRNTFPFLDRKRQNKFLMNQEFTFSDDMLKASKKHLRESRTDDSLILAWEQFIQAQAELVDNVNPSFEKVIKQYFMKNNKKVLDVLNSLQKHDKKEKLTEPFHSGLYKE